MKIETLGVEFGEVNNGTRNAWGGGGEQARGEGSGAKEVVRQNQANNENEKYVSSNIRRESDHSVADKAMQGSPEVERNGMNVHTISIALNKRVKMIDKLACVLSTVIKSKYILKKLICFYNNLPILSITFGLWFLCSANLLSIWYGKPLLSTNVYVGLQPFLWINLILSQILYMNIEIMIELMKSFNFWFTIWNVLSFHSCFVLLWGASLGTFFIITHSFISVLILVFFDARLGKHNLHIKLISIIGLISYLPILAVLSFRLVDFQEEKYYDKDTGVEIMDVRLQAVDNLSTMMVYFARIIYTNVFLKKTTTVAFLSTFFEIENQSNQKQRDGQENSKKKEKSHQTDASGRNMASVAPGEPSMRKIDNDMCIGRHGKILEVEVNVGSSGDHNESDRRNRLKNKLLIGIMESKSIKYDLYDTIYHKHISNRYPTLAWLLKSNGYNAFGIICCVSSLFISFAIAIGFISNELFTHTGTALVVFGIFFLGIQMVTTSNLFMVRNMLRSFDYWYVMLLLIKIFITSGFLCNWDVRTVSWIFIIIITQWSSMIDTFHISKRKLTYFSIFGIMWMLPASVLCKLNVGGTFSEDKLIEFPGIRPISSRITFATSAFYFCLFNFRFLWSYIQNPNRVFFVTENVRVEEVQ